MRRLIVAVLLVLCASTAGARPFSFVAYGDTGYKVPRDLTRVEQLVDQINAEKPAFSIHVGDFKGYSSCSDAAYQEHKLLLNRHDHPLILTPRGQ